MEAIKKILRTPSAFVLFLVAIVSLIGVIIKSETDKAIARMPIDATSTAEARLTEIANFSNMTQSALLLSAIWTPSPTETIKPLPANTNTPGPTPIPGVQVYPVSSLGNGIPWLPIEIGKEPMSVYYGFNVNKPPFNNALVRQAFAAAIDREQIAQEAVGFKFRNVTPATSLTPPQTLGYDLYGAVGIPFNPAKAKDLLYQAGYPDGAGFPSVTLIVSTRGKEAPEAYTKMAQTIIGMWKTYLGIDVNLEVEANWGQYLNVLKDNPRDMYQMGWGADDNDPNNFLKLLFYSTSEFNYGRFNNQEFDHLVEKAANLSDPSERQLLYIQAEQILTEQEAAVIPLYHTLWYQQP